MGKKEEQICSNEKWKPELCILLDLKMKFNNLSDMIDCHYKLRYGIYTFNQIIAILSRTFTV